MDLKKDNEDWVKAASDFQEAIKEQFKSQEEKKVIELEAKVFRFLQNWYIKGNGLFRDTVYVKLMDEIIDHPKIHEPLLFQNTTLMYAAFFCCYPLIHSLVQKGCNVNVRDHHGLTILERLAIAEKVLVKRLGSSSRVNTIGLFHAPNYQNFEKIQLKAKELLIHATNDEILRESIGNLLRLRDYRIAQKIVDKGIFFSDHHLGKDGRPITYWAFSDEKAMPIGIRLRSLAQWPPFKENMRVKNSYDMKIQNILEHYQHSFLMSLSNIRSILNRDFELKSLESSYTELSFLPKGDIDRLEKHFLKLKTFFLYQQIPLFNAIRINDNNQHPKEWIDLLYRSFFKELGHHNFVGYRSQLLIEMILNFFCSFVVMDQLIVNIKKYIEENKGVTDSIYESPDENRDVMNFLKQFNSYQQDIAVKVLILQDLVHLNPAILSNVVLEHLFGNIRSICHQHPVVLALWFYEQRSVLKFEANDENSAKVAHYSVH